MTLQERRENLVKDLLMTRDQIKTLETQHDAAKNKEQQLLGALQVIDTLAAEAAQAEKAAEAEGAQ